MQIPPHSHNHPPPPHLEQANIHSCKPFPSLYGFSRILFDFTQRLHFSRPFSDLAFPLIVALFQILIFLHAACLSFDYVWVVKESDSDTVIMVIVLVVGVGGIFMLFAVMALCYRSLQNINMREKFALFCLQKEPFSRPLFFLSSHLLLTGTFFFLPDSFAESDHSQYPLVSIIGLLFWHFYKTLRRF